MAAVEDFALTAAFSEDLVVFSVEPFEVVSEALVTFSVSFVLLFAVEDLALLSVVLLFAASVVLLFAVEGFALLSVFSASTLSVVSEALFVFSVLLPTVPCVLLLLFAVFSVLLPNVLLLPVPVVLLLFVAVVSTLLLVCAVLELAVSFPLLLKLLLLGCALAAAIIAAVEVEKTGSCTKISSCAIIEVLCCLKTFITSSQVVLKSPSIPAQSNAFTIILVNLKGTFSGNEFLLIADSNESPKSM